MSEPVERQPEDEEELVDKPEAIPEDLGPAASVEDFEPEDHDQEAIIDESQPTP